MGLTAELYARMQKALLPPGGLRTALESRLHETLLGSADELARVDARGDDLLREALPTSAVELLPEYEAQFALASTGTDEERQARVTAATVRETGTRPSDIHLALAPLLGQDPEDVVVLERTPDICVDMGDQREIFRYFVYRDPSLPGTYYLDAAQSLLYTMSDSHTVGHVIETLAATCDDPLSLCDRDPVGL